MARVLGMRLAVFCDYRYRREATGFTVERPFGLFLMGLAEHCERLVLVGRLDPGAGSFPYRVVDTEVALLPSYAAASDVRAVLGATLGAMASFWRLLDDVDTVWLLGPHPWCIAFAAMARVRGRRAVLGVRQDLPRLIRLRHPRRRVLHAAADALELAYRGLARRLPVVVVGPELAASYRRARELHELYVSLLREADLADPGLPGRSYDGPVLIMLSVGRLAPEKNPLLLADVLACALRRDPRWRLDVCGDGPLAAPLAERLRELGLADRGRLLGHVPVDGGLVERYRESHVFMHVSLTEGMPQVLLEAFAARLPVAATAVGGVPEMVAGRGLLVEPGDAPAAARAAGRLVDEPGLRAELQDAGEALARAHTLESECAGLATFLAGASA
ncbi:MAG: hypothetical protein QOD61_2384 [Solirubrobacteraceae bacterium]|nr:hypothetical protein [Solirubrobacteraceae bacterium]